MLTRYRLNGALFIKEVPFGSHKWLHIYIFLYLTNNLKCLPMLKYAVPSQ